MLDEPTTGLHFSDIELLLVALEGLRDAGNTVLVIEHNLDLVASADWVLDLGPEGGTRGGQLVAEGPPEHLATVASSPPPPSQRSAPRRSRHGEQAAKVVFESEIVRVQGLPQLRVGS